MKAHIQTEPLTRSVKVFLWEEAPGDRAAFYWPVSVEGNFWAWQRNEEDRYQEPRPAFEMSRDMWEAIIDAIQGVTKVEALDIIAKTLEREQDRVDKLLDVLVKPAIVIEGKVRQ